VLVLFQGKSLPGESVQNQQPIPLQTSTLFRNMPAGFRDLAEMPAGIAKSGAGITE
jgi:hypothetical protein